jgi:threonylcarbamoyladenosine tRNA methylthiotransferase MtaB
MFENTLALVDEAGLSYLHVFPFSPRKGTPAARMPQLPRAAIKARARRLREKGEKALSARLSGHIGSEQTLLVEKPGRGRTPCFAIAEYEGAGEAGRLLRVHIESSNGHILRARVLHAVEQQNSEQQGPRAAA